MPLQWKHGEFVPGWNPVPLQNVHRMPITYAAPNPSVASTMPTAARVIVFFMLFESFGILRTDIVLMPSPGGVPDVAETCSYLFFLAG